MPTIHIILIPSSFSTSWERRHQSQSIEIQRQRNISHLFWIFDAKLFCWSWQKKSKKLLFIRVPLCAVAHHHCCKTVAEQSFNLPLLQTRNEKVGNICDGFIMNANQDGSLGSDRLSKYESTWEPQSPRGNKIWIIPSGSCAATAGNLPPLWSTLFWHLRTKFDLWSFIVPSMTVKNMQDLKTPKWLGSAVFSTPLPRSGPRNVCVQVNSNQRGLRF